MHNVTPETLFARYRETGDAKALGAVFDRLAAELVLVSAHLAGSDVAEDLVQATFLDAIRHRDRWDASRPLAPWLLGLLGNHVRRSRRLRQRVPDRERLTIPESVSPDEEAAASEAIAEVHRAVEQLPRHYRQVLSLRFVHGLQLVQIATSLDMPLGTVKVRLHRGVDLLRRALPSGLASAVALVSVCERGFAAVRSTVLTEGAIAVPYAVTATSAASANGAGPATGSTTTTTTVGTGWWFGAWIMKKFAMGVAVCLLAVAGWLAMDQLQVPDPVAPARPASRQVGATVEQPVAPFDDESAAVRQHAPGPVSSHESPLTGSLKVKVVWQSDGAPASQIAITVCAVQSSWPLVNSRSDSDGFVALANLAPGRYRVALPPLGSREEVAVRAGETSHCDIVVTDEHRLRVVVVDADSVPQSGANVWGNEMFGNETLQNFGSTDAAGVLHYRGPRLEAVWARMSGRQPSACHEVAQAKFGAETVEEAVTLVLGDNGCTLLGSVVDPLGRPVAGARVAIAVTDAWHSNNDPVEVVTTTAGDGRFACNELPTGERFVVASSPGFAPAVTRATTSAELEFLALTLGVGGQLSGQVTDAAGEPIAGVAVQVFSQMALAGVRGPWGNCPQTSTDRDGNYSLRGILPGAGHAIVSLSPIIKRGLTLQHGEEQAWNVQQAPELSLHGVVVDSDDEPLSGWMVEVTAPGGLGNHSMSRATTDDGGRFRVDRLEDRDYQVRVFSRSESGDQVSPFGGGIARATVATVRPSSEPLTVRIKRAAMSNGWIEGSLVMPEGPPQSVSVSLVAKAGMGWISKGLEPGVTTFRFGPLPAGEYDVTCEIEGSGRMQAPTVALLASETLRLAPFVPGVPAPAEVVLKFPDARPCAGASVMLMPGMITCRETAPGHYVSRPVSTGAYEAVVHGPGFAPMRIAMAASADGPTERTVTPAATVQLVLQPALARKQWKIVALVVVKDGSGAEILNSVLPIDGGEDFVWSLGLSAGVYSVRVRCSDGNGSTTVSVGEEAVRMELPLRR